MNGASRNYKKGLLAMGLCYLIWGFQPLYFVIDQKIDTTFLLACRIIWAAVFCLALLLTQRKTAQLAQVFRNRKILLREIPAAVLLFADWAIYLYAVRMGKVMECSMGYYIMPLVMVAFGALIFREKIGAVHYAALIFIVIGIILSAEGFGGFPWVTILLSLCFAVYSALKKSLTIDSIVTTTAEILMMAPLAMLYICISAEDLSAMSFGRLLFTMGSGVITALPMLFFAIGITCLPLSLTGIFQYVSPSLGLICSLIMGETFSREKLISFSFIWIGVIIYSAYELRAGKRRQL